MSKKKIIAMIISVVMVFSLIPTAVFAIQVDEWVTGQGYGSITPNSDGTYTFQGDSELNTDNSQRSLYQSKCCKSGRWRNSRICRCIY